MKKRSKRLWFKYLIELFIVIIGISIAFWLNNLATATNNQKQRATYLTDIANDLRTDSISLSFNIKNNIRKRKILLKSLELIENTAPIDSLLPYVLEIGNYDFFKPDNFTLTSLLQSGDFKLIDAPETKRELLRLLKIYEFIENSQNNFLEALDENYFPMLISKVDMTSMKVTNAQFFYETEIKNYCGFTISETAQHIENYEVAQAQIAKVMQLIQSDLKQ